jgi:SAM-dependent methyltransferase
VEHDWSRYEGLFVDKSRGAVSISDGFRGPSPGRAALINQKLAISYRDELISNSLGTLSVTKIVDIGCDFGSLLFEASRAGIESIGLDPSEEAVTLCALAGLSAVQGRYQDLSNHESPVRQQILHFLDSTSGRTAVSLLGILHAEKNDSALWYWIRANVDLADYFVLTVNRRQLKNLKALGLRVHSRIGASTKTPALWQAHLQQYGRTFFFTEAKGILHTIEGRLWEIIRGRHTFPDKLSTYSRLVVILEKSR